MLESDDELNDLRKGAENGNAESQYLLAVSCHMGESGLKEYLQNPLLLYAEHAG